MWRPGNDNKAPSTTPVTTLKWRPTINQNAVAGSSKPFGGQATQSRNLTTSKPSQDASGGVPAKKTSLPNPAVRISSGSIPQTEAPPKYSTSNGDGIGYHSASSPATPPPETPILSPARLEIHKDKSRSLGLSNLFQDRMRRPYSACICPA